MQTDPEYKLILGNLEYQNIETGYWALNDGERKYRVIDIPKELKHEGIHVATMSEIIDDEVSIFSTTLNIKIIEYKILS